MGHLYFDSVAEFQSAFGPHANAIVADIPRYTDIQPTFQISEVKICASAFQPPKKYSQLFVIPAQQAVIQSRRKWRFRDLRLELVPCSLMLRLVRVGGL